MLQHNAGLTGVAAWFVRRPAGLRERSGRDVAVQFAYVTNFGSDNVSAYSIDVASGGLTRAGGVTV